MTDGIDSKRVYFAIFVFVKEDVEDAIFPGTTAPLTRLAGTKSFPVYRARKLQGGAFVGDR